MRAAIRSASASSVTASKPSGSVARTMDRATAGSAARIPRITAALRACSAIEVTTYMTPSTIPQARLQASAATSIACTSSLPPAATLTEPVKASTMTSPKMISEKRSMGSRARFRYSPATRWARAVCAAAWEDGVIRREV